MLCYIYHGQMSEESGCFDRSALLSDWTEQVITKIKLNQDRICCIGMDVTETCDMYD